jgi:hypothetical protein
VLVFLWRLLQVLFALLVVRLLLRGLASWARGSGRPREDVAASRTLVRDRMCNTFLPRDRALRARVGGREEFFCSTACRDLALANGLAAPPAITRVEQPK